jgi:hypothetical protein
VTEMSPRVSAGALDLCTHLVEHLAQIDDVRFTRGVVDGRDTFSDHGRHQDVLGRADRGELELDLRAVQLVGGRDHATVLDVAFRAELPQARLVHVQGSRADGVAARKRDAGAFAPSDERAQHAHRGAELSHRGEVRFVLGLFG